VAKDVHLTLAILSVLTLFAATIEGLIRAIKSKPAGAAAGRLGIAVLVVVGITAAAGVALLISGKRPHQWLHLVYAAMAFGLIPVADNAAFAMESPRNSGLARFGGGVVALLVVARLFVTA